MPALRLQRCKQPHATAVHVLVFIDQYMIVGLLQLDSCCFIRLQHLHRPHDQITKVQATCLPLQSFIYLIYFCYFQSALCRGNSFLAWGCIQHTLCHGSILLRVNNLVFCS
ncbi:hypothetical protein RN02_12530 [Pseudomonas sp. PI1]|nr:hypothetical protein RN02_12530 [Pseudomonas sp. PI1]